MRGIHVSVQENKFYITTPIYYADSNLHIGHAYTTVAADALARYHRLRGDDTFYLTGTDEHGQKVQQAAQESGVAPKEFVDRQVARIKQLWQKLRIDYDYFIRTTDPEHEKVVQDIFAELHERGDIYPSAYEGWYCTPCESFWLESKLEGGNSCPDCGRPVQWVEEKAYFFRLSKYAGPLLEHIDRNPGFIQPDSRRNEVTSFIRSGLEDLCVSRSRESLQWGIPVPFDPSHVIYVWFDAVCNYITAIGYGRGEEEFRRWWPADVHLIGKEILRFHAVIWPSMLMALGVPLPHQIFGHGWLVMGGEKISKSRGNVVDPFVLVDKYGLDAVRYYLLREVPFGADGRYTEEALIDRTNVDLANDLGNLLNRVTTMIHRYCQGRIPSPGGPLAQDVALRRAASEARSGMEEALDGNLLSAGLEAIWTLVRAANKYLEDTAPWDLARRPESAGELGTVLYNAAEALRLLAVLLAPFLVETPGRIWQQLGLTSDIAGVTWADTDWGLLQSGSSIERGTILFPRIDAEEALGQPVEERGATVEDEKGEQEGMASTQNEARTAPIKEEIAYETFSRMDLRVARIVEAEAIPGADKLLRLEVDLGGERRQVVAGIAQHYDPESLAGRLVVVVANLAPARIFGVESQGMVLAAEDDGGLALLRPDKDLRPGSVVK